MKELDLEVITERFNEAAGLPWGSPQVRGVRFRWQGTDYIRDGVRTGEPAELYRLTQRDEEPGVTEVEVWGRDAEQFAVWEKQGGTLPDLERFVFRIRRPEEPTLVSREPVAA